eukprot:jgi/Orpsp1_1/1186364/evm.model.d7180000050022.1
MNENYRKSISSVKRLIFGGERVTNDLLQYISKYMKCEFYIGYGLSESISMSTLNCCNIEKVLKSKFSTIGKPC